MNKSGPIIIIEDDKDDQLLFQKALGEIQFSGEVLFFNDGEEAYDYLTTITLQPFLIISDINLPKLNGIELKEKIHNNEMLNLKCIPYLFFSTTAEQKHVIDAYSKSVQGFFTKPTKFDELVRVLSNIVDYWKDCHSPDIPFIQLTNSVQGKPVTGN